MPNRFGLFLYELLGLVSLYVEQRRQIRMIEPCMSRGRHCRLGPEGDTETRFAQHGEVVGAVTHGHGLVQSQTKAGAQLDQGCKLRLATENGFFDETGE